MSDCKCGFLHTSIIIYVLFILIAILSVTIFTSSGLLLVRIYNLMNPYNNYVLYMDGLQGKTSIIIGDNLYLYCIIVYIWCLAAAA